MALSEQQQPPIAHTYELSLPIKLLPGEDDVKLREGILILSSFLFYLFISSTSDITYCTHNRSVQFRGELIVTKYRLLFVKKPPDPIQVNKSSKNYHLILRSFDYLGTC